MVADYLSLVWMRLKSQMSYGKSFWIEIFGHMLYMATHLGSISFVFYHIHELHGWNFWQVVYLYALSSLAFSMSQFLGEGFEDLHIAIKSGEFDRYLTRPVSPLLQIASLSFKIDRLGGIVQGFVLLGIALEKTHVGFQMITVVSLCSLVMIFYSLFLVCGASSFWTLDSSEFFNAFTYGGVEVGKYPLSIYQNWMQKLFLYLIPIGAVGYGPSCTLFGYESPFSWYLAPLISFVFLIICFGFWVLGLKRYQSTGS